MFEGPERKRQQAVDNTVLLIARVEAVVKCSPSISGEMATIMQKQHAQRDKFHKELDRLLELLAAQRRLVESQARKSAPVLQRGETAEAQFVLAAQRRTNRRVER